MINRIRSAVLASLPLLLPAYAVHGSAAAPDAFAYAEIWQPLTISAGSTARMTILDRFRVDTRVAIVAFASSGLGVGFARALAEAGADMVLGAKRADRR